MRRQRLACMLNTIAARAVPAPQCTPRQEQVVWLWGVAVRCDRDSDVWCDCDCGWLWRMTVTVACLWLWRVAVTYGWLWPVCDLSVTVACDVWLWQCTPRTRSKRWRMASYSQVMTSRSRISNTCWVVRLMCCMALSTQYPPRPWPRPVAWGCTMPAYVLYSVNYIDPVSPKHVQADGQSQILSPQIQWATYNYKCRLPPYSLYGGELFLKSK